jgi:hypothetical protein
MDNKTKMTEMFDKLYIFVEKNDLGNDFEKLLNLYDFHYTPKED